LSPPSSSPTSFSISILLLSFFFDRSSLSISIFSSSLSSSAISLSIPSSIKSSPPISSGYGPLEISFLPSSS
ncbi:hypothetical protein PENTCL1PPCAC_13900, partial [Pristionchus entomophagus]